MSIDIRKLDNQLQGILGTHQRRARDQKAVQQIPTPSAPRLYQLAKTVDVVDIDLQTHDSRRASRLVDIHGLVLCRNQRLICASHH